MHFSRSPTEDVLASAGDQTVAVFAAVLNFLFLFFEVAKLRMGLPYNLRWAVSWIGHLAFFGAGAAAVADPGNQGMRRALSAIAVTSL
jgi:hypothetical protein